jgi:hypothetical protein
MVRKGGLEPPCLSAPPPQDGVSANFTTSAHWWRKAVTSIAKLISVPVISLVQGYLQGSSRCKSKILEILPETRRFLGFL